MQPKWPDKIRCCFELNLQVSKLLSAYLPFSLPTHKPAVERDLSQKLVRLGIWLRDFGGQLLPTALIELARLLHHPFHGTPARKSVKMVRRQHLKYVHQPSKPLPG